MTSHDPHTQPPRTRDATIGANPDDDPAQQEWARSKALAAGVPEEELDTERTGDPHPARKATDEKQPETQGVKPLVAELGARGEGVLGPNDLLL